MRHIANIRLGLVEFLLLVGGALTWTSCINDNIDYDMGYDEGYDVVDNEEEQVTVRLNISAGQSGGISVSRADEYAGSYTDTNAKEREYMNTLCVFVVDASGFIVKKLTPATSDDGWEGTWPEWTSSDEDELTLPTGTYTVYAFSNWETVASESGDDDWSKIIALEVDEELSADELAIDIIDPASMVDLTNEDESQRKYIPMSGSSTITVSKDTTLDVVMDRLVGRVEVTIYGETGEGAEDITLNTFSFGGCADRVPLMKVEGGGNEATQINYNNVYEISSDEMEAVSDEENAYTFYFYVNETYRTNGTAGEATGGFSISLTTDGDGDVTYSATTANTEIPRNNIYPIALTLGDYELELTPTAMTSIVGYDGELEYTNVYYENHTYSITMLDVTSTFTITPKLSAMDNSTPDDLAWTWTYVEVDEDGTTTETVIKEEPAENVTPQCTVDRDGVLTVTALTATPDYGYAFTLEAAWTTGNSTGTVSHSRLYNVTVTFVYDFPVFRSSRAWWMRGYGSELLRLRVGR